MQSQPPVPSTQIPAACSSAILINDTSRDVNQPAGCMQDDGLAAGWYRFFQSSSNAYIPEIGNSCNSSGWGPPCLWGACNTQRGGMFVGPSHPSLSDFTPVTRTLQFPWGTTWTQYTATIQACGSYSVYNLPAITSQSWGGVWPSTTCAAKGGEFRFCTTSRPPAVGPGTSMLPSQ
jgi:hypothetical protein